jgi:hypothetical protein
MQMADFDLQNENYEEIVIEETGALVMEGVPEEILTQVAANTAARHTHANKAALDDLAEELTYQQIYDIWNS